MLLAALIIIGFLHIFRCALSDYAPEQSAREVRTHVRMCGSGWLPFVAVHCIGAPYQNVYRQRTANARDHANRIISFSLARGANLESTPPASVLCTRVKLKTLCGYVCFFLLTERTHRQRKYRNRKKSEHMRAGGGYVL